MHATDDRDSSWLVSTKMHTHVCTHMPVYLTVSGRTDSQAAGMCVVVLLWQCRLSTTSMSMCVGSCEHCQQHCCRLLQQYMQQTSWPPCVCWSCTRWHTCAHAFIWIFHRYSRWLVSARQLLQQYHSSTCTAAVHTEKGRTIICFGRALAAAILFTKSKACYFCAVQH